MYNTKRNIIPNIKKLVALSRALAPKFEIDTTNGNDKAECCLNHF